MPFLASVLAAAGTDLLLCGGVSDPCRSLFLQTGINVIPWIRGSNDEVLRALAAGRLAAMAMPGCRGRCCCRRQDGRGR
jgi:predicted Fe-Mo cluster-binding NifX family protein